ncbi:hypothetical protein TNCV_3715121 [Trichonephila clavipes]|nr:hypothetical protein TNCV_3715121 [Trichonephila clavipes]
MLFVDPQRCHEFEPSTTKDPPCRGKMHVKSVESSNVLLLECFHAEIVEVEIEVASPSMVPSRNFAELNRTLTCMALKTNDRRTSNPMYDEFRGPRSDYVRQVTLETTATLLA